MPSRDKEPTSAVYRFAAIGTGWQIRSNHPLSDAVTTEIAALCEHFDRTWSRFRADSMVTEIAQAHDGGRFVFPARDASLLDLYDGLVDATAGGVDPLIGRDLELLGYDANYLLRPDRAGLSKHVPDSWDRDLRREETTLIASRPVLIDIGAAGKGHLVDLIADVLVAAGIGGFVVDGGGDLRHAGSQPVVVGLEHPTHIGRVLGTVKLQDAALCASSTTRRSWGEGLHHILDGRVRKPVPDVVASWTIAEDAATADGLATALFVSDPDQLTEFEFTWVRMLADGRVQWANDFPGELFI